MADKDTKKAAAASAASERDKNLNVALAQIEKAIGKPTLYEIAGSHIVTPKGKPTLAPASDKREPYRTTAEEDFSEIPTF